MLYYDCPNFIFFKMICVVIYCSCATKMRISFSFKNDYNIHLSTLNQLTLISYPNANNTRFLEYFDYTSAQAIINDSKDIVFDPSVDPVFVDYFSGIPVVSEELDLVTEEMAPYDTDMAGYDIWGAIADVFNTLNTREGAYYINPNDTSSLATGNNVNIFNVDANGKTSAGTISVNEALLSEDGCWMLACAYFDPKAGITPDLRAVGNAQNVVAMLQTRSTQMDGLENRPDLNGMTIEEAYTSLLGKIAASGSNGQALADTQQNVVDSVYNQIKSNNSVDLNEELVDLVKYQTAYSAAAQVFNTCNSCLDVLMSLGG